MTTGTDNHANHFWSASVSDMIERLRTSPRGLSGDDARERLARFGHNTLKPKRKTGDLTLLLSQFRSPIILILIFAAGLSWFLQDHTDAAIILAIIIISSLLGFWQERAAADAVRKLLATIQTSVEVFRDGTVVEVPLEEIVPGDVIQLSAGVSIPGDSLILDSRDMFVDEATLTGETYPVEKAAGVLPPDTPLAKRTNSLFMGTHVVSGSAKAIAVLTGTKTEFGKVAQRLRLRPPETEFEHGVKRFGYFLMEVTLVMLTAIFFVNVILQRPILEAFLFSLAIAVGLTPQLLPAIITVNLSHGAKRMAAAKVIVRRLASIENFGSMNVLCSDKTGTLTKGVVSLNSALDAEGKPSEKTHLYAYLNSTYETSFINPIDKSIREGRRFDTSGCEKLDEVPYDFIRKRLTILVRTGGRSLMITKGAVPNVLSICSTAETSDGRTVDINDVRSRIQAEFEKLSGDGFRVLCVAHRDLGSATRITKDDETGMTLTGFLVFSDELKDGIAETINNLKRLGVTLKIITGDNRHVAAYVGKQVGIENPQVITGPQVSRMSDQALFYAARHVGVFAEIEPNQKEKIIMALKKGGYVVGYMGDGINDASALYTADVGISVDQAADVAKEAADFVLLEKDLNVLEQGIRAGRVTFANTLKYVFMAGSTNFGNMFSMAGASLFLPFLPLLPKQILLTNLMTDFPEMTIATDSVDAVMTDYPRKWNIAFIRKFMITFGVLSSVFDYITFGVLLYVMHASREVFRTGWFVESVVSAALIVLVIRTRLPFYKSKPGKYLLTASLLIVAATFLLPYSPAAGVLGFAPLPPLFLAIVAGIIILYVLAAETTKRIFYRHVKF
jgi:Mg2+-importing ATPase